MSYQKEPFKINLGKLGSFEVLAAEGTIRPCSKKAKAAVTDARKRKVMERVESIAYSYFGRPDWTWV